MIVAIPLDILFIALAVSSGNGLDDPNLAARIKKGDHSAFKDLFDLHHAELYRYLVSRKVPGNIAEDLVQQAFVKIWEMRSDINEDLSLRAYLFRIAYTRMLNHFRDQAKFDDSGDIPDTAGSTVLRADSATQQREIREAIAKALETLPERRRAVFELCFLKEFSYKETAEALEISVKTVENHMGHALKAMRKALAYMKDE